LHGVAIRLRDEGLDDHVIAVALGLDDDQVPALLHIAGSKLDRLMAPPVSPAPRGGAETVDHHAGSQANRRQKGMS
jgi:hypothetical protein